MTSDLSHEDIAALPMEPASATEPNSFAEQGELSAVPEPPSAPSESQPPHAAAEAEPQGEKPAAKEASRDADTGTVEEQPLRLSDLRTGMQLPGVVKSVTKLGAFVDVGIERDGLIHVSELRKVGADGELKKNDEIEVWVLNADSKANRLSLSLEEKTPLKQLRPGATLTGRVVRLTNFGAFVDVGSVVDGLVHASEISASNSDGQLKVGQEIQVFVRSVNRRSRRLSLGLGSRTPLADIQTGTDTVGRVTRLTEFGAFVDIGATVDGLVHVSELPGTGQPQDLLKVSEEVRVRVQQVDQGRRRISLSMRGVSQPGTEAVEAVEEHVPTAMEIAMQQAEERARRKQRRRR